VGSLKDDFYALLRASKQKEPEEKKNIFLVKKFVGTKVFSKIFPM
jgi:hypothetical protein